MAIIIEVRGDTPVLKCEDCNAWEHQKPSATIHHSRRCDSKNLQPTPEQRGVVATQPQVQPAPATVTVRGSDGSLREEDAEYMRRLRASGHSWRDINSGNTDF